MQAPTPKFPGAKTYRRGNRVWRLAKYRPKKIQPIKPITAPPSAPAGIPVKPIDYRALSSYITGTAANRFEAGNSRSEIQDQLASNSRLYARATTDLKEAFPRRTRGIAADMNRRGLLRSGARDVSNADAFKQASDQLADLEERFGSIASQRLNAALQQVAERERLSQQGVEAQAVDEYRELYPAAPLPIAGQAVKPVVKPAAPVSPAKNQPGVGMVADTAPPRAASKSRFPNARTYKDAQGRTRLLRRYR